MKQFFIKVENISTPIQSYQVFNFDDDAVTPQELIAKIRDRYNFKETEKIRLELWTGPMGSSERECIDWCKVIPDKFTTLWVKGYVINQNKDKRD